MTQQTKPKPAPAGKPAAARDLLKIKARLLGTRVQVRKALPTKEYLRELGGSFIAQPIHPVIVRLDATLNPPEFVVLDGHLRLAGVMLLDPEHELECLVVDRELSAAEVIELQLISGLHSTSIQPFDLAVAIKDWKEMHPDRKAAELAAKLDYAAGTLTKIASVWNCVAEVQEQAKAGRITPAAWYQISLVADPDGQRGLMELYLSGMPAAQVAALSRKQRAAAPDAGERVKLVRIPLATEEARGCVTVAGEPGHDLDLATAEDILKAAIKRVQDAQKRGIGAKAACAAWKDQAATRPAK